MRGMQEHVFWAVDCKTHIHPSPVQSSRTRRLQTHIAIWARDYHQIRVRAAEPNFFEVPGCT